MVRVINNPQRVELRNVVKSYRGFTLGPLTLTLEPGVTALLGANGAGKTTLMQLIVGSARVSSGKVIFPEAAGTRVGFLPQDFAGPPRASARDYLTYIAWCRSTRKHKISAEAVSDALAAVGLNNKAESRIGTLSGGMVRRLGVAQALLAKSSVLVLDEPTVGLDPIQRRDLRELIARLGQETTVLMSTHLAEDVAAIADQVLVIEEGKLLEAGPVANLCNGSKIDSASVEAGFLRLVAEMGTHQGKSRADYE